MPNKAYNIEGQNRLGRWVVTCDHAANFVPDWINGGDLGVSAADMERHIAYDVGAAGVTRYLAEHLNSPAVLSNFSRLVIDPNRGDQDPTLLRKIYDGSVIPANRHADNDELERRKAKLYYPYHAAIAELAGQRDKAAICAIHSFTPQLQNQPRRPWEVGILYADDTRLAHPVLAACRDAGWCVGDNQPYSGDLPGDAIDQHTLQHGRPNVLIEIRSDLIEDDAGQLLWASQLAPILETSLAQVGL